MKKFNQRKSIMEQGGLMIEALAMLGLIAVVTPTMYKKSAERTMEVEDINTASAIRTYMNGVESLLAANYTELMEKIEEPGEGESVKIVPLDDNLKLTVGDEQVSAKEELQKYLPYGYNAEDSLYNYGQPQFAVARSGNNLSAFMVFPAKASEEDGGIGQERTVRIASLIGSNGGYVGTSGNARGVGGTWSLSGEDLKTITGASGEGASGPGEHSIVTSSIDVVNGAEGMGGDMTKYLQRTAENGETWRNTMRTDIYMGEFENRGNDYDDKTTDGYFSIRNINQLIVGADGYIAANDTSNNQDSDATDLAGLYKGAKADEAGSAAEAFSKFGLYISDEPDPSDPHKETKKHGINAYIAGSLEAAGRRLFADEEELTYHGPKIQLGGIDEDEETGTATKYLITAVTENANSGENSGELEPNPESQGKNRVEIMPVSIGEGDASNPLIIASDSDLNDEVNIGNISEEKSAGTKLLLAKEGDKTVDGTNDAPEISYDNAQPVPQFPVVVDSNMAVNGVLAAGQLDTQKIRAATLSVGSPNINDELKWMDVDEAGVHVHSRTGKVASVDADGNPVVGTAKTQLEVNDDVIAMRIGANAQNAATDDSETGHDTQFILSEKGAKIITKGESTSEHEHAIELSTGGVGERLENNQITIGNPTSTAEATAEYRVKYENGGHVDMVGTTLQVTDKNAKPVLTIRGNETNESSFGTNYNDASTQNANNYKIAGHGNAVFTSDAVSATGEEGAVKYLAMGTDADGTMDAGVTIVSSANKLTDDEKLKSQRVLVVDLDTGSKNAYVGPDLNDKDKEKVINGSKARSIKDGMIYVRKGLIDIAPVTPENSVATNNNKALLADESSSTVRASRFVANNIDKDGNRIKFHNPLGGVKDNRSGVKKYDTYMVNPAYTSVMKDIKLTSRMGARLSDILPDFINKGIYYSNNGYDESKGYPDPSLPYSSDPSDSYVGDSAYASPYLGSVPAPQCPPGYARALTVVPIGFEMGQVGSLGSSNAMAGLDVTQYNMLGLKTDENGFVSTEGSNNIETNFASKEELLESQPAYGRIRNLEMSSDKNLNAIPAELQMTSGSHTKHGGEWDPHYDDLFYHGSTTEYPVEPAGDLENRIMLEGGLAKKAVTDSAGNVKNTDQNILLDAAAARFDQRSVADLRNQTLYVDHFGYGGSGHDDDVINYDEGANLALRADVIATKYDNAGNLMTGQHVGSPEEGAYFLVSSNPNQQPLTFQKSTWLKTEHDTLCTEGTERKADGSLKCKGYGTGWNIYMGFVYPDEIYADFAQKAGLVNSFHHERGFYWNLFPVRKETLHAYATVYCFIDNTSATDQIKEFSSAEWGSDWEDSDLAKDGNIQYDFGAWYTNENAPKADKRNEFLNDPALKYNEVW